jgi:tRNA A37 threonylcarbamoyltransferase TsaD
MLSSSAIHRIARKLALAYPGNLGFQEMMSFYQSADDQQIKLMESYLNSGDFDSAWTLLQEATDTQLYTD